MNDDDRMLGYPEGPLTEDDHAPQLDRLHEISPDHALPPAEPYSTITENIPASPLDLTTVAQSVAGRVAWDDPVEYARIYTEQIVAASQALADQIGTDND